MNPSTPIGHNQTPFQLLQDEVNNLHEEAKNWLDGEKVTGTQEPEIDKLLTMLKDVKKRERSLFKKTKDPHAKAAKEVDTLHNPLKAKIENAIKAGLAAVTPLREAREAAAAEEQRKAIEEAETATRLAQEASVLRDETNLTATEEMQSQVKAAKKLTTQANKLSKRKTGLRTTWDCTLKDTSAAARHYFIKRPGEFSEFLTGLAKTDVIAGAREIPGFEIVEKKEAR